MTLQSSRAAVMVVVIDRPHSASSFRLDAEDLPGKRMPGTEDGSRPEFAWRGAERSVTAGRHWPHGSGEDRPASAARTRQRPREREAARQPTPQERAVPRLPAAVGLVALPVSVRAPLSATSRLSAPEPGQAPALACRRRALKKTRKESCHTPSAHSGRGRGPGARRVRKLADGEFSPSIDVSLLPQASIQIRMRPNKHSISSHRAGL
jgi:hypothetical protein